MKKTLFDRILLFIRFVILSFISLGIYPLFFAFDRTERIVDALEGSKR